jgi:hypothetical protein
VDEREWSETVNQDFGLSLTSSIARRLLRFQQTCNIILPDDLQELATKNVVTEADFDPFVLSPNETRLMATQFLLDCNLRAIVQQTYHPTITELTVMNAVRLMKPESVTVMTARSNIWSNASKAFFLDAKIVRPFDLNGEDIDKRRSGVLIVDYEPSHFMYRDFGNEFAQTIFFDRTRDWSSLVPWPILAQSMFPTMPTPLYPRVVQKVSDTYNKPLHMFAPLYNVCLFPELVEPSNGYYLTDKYLHSNVQRYRFI